jgi:capsular polysaccharide biosynthesis protein
VRVAGQGPRSIVRATNIARIKKISFESGGLFYGNPAENFKGDICRLLREPPRHALILPEAGIYDDDGVIYDLHSKAALEETLGYYELDPRSHPVFALPRVLQSQRLTGLSIFLGGLGGQTFYHFVAEIIPKIEILRSVLPSCERILIQSHIEEAKAAWLHAAGIDRPIQWLRPLQHYHCDELAFALPVANPAEANPWVVGQLRHIFAVPQSSPTRPRRIWIDRRAAPVRGIPWETDIIRRLPSGWEAVDFARLSPSQTLAICKECSVLAGFHGAGLTNSCFIPPGATIVEFLQTPERPWYSNLSRSSGHVHFTYRYERTPSDVLKRLERL